MDINLFLVQKLHSVLAKAGRGGSLPGTLALKLDRDFLSRFQMPERTVLVTGTNGKTTTMNLIAEAMKANGLKVVCNHRGDNLNVGLATTLAIASDDQDRVQADAAVLEVDELTLYRTFNTLHPTALVVYGESLQAASDAAGQAQAREQQIADIQSQIKTFYGRKPG